MKKIGKRLAREWEKTLFWLGFICLAGSLAWYLTDLLNSGGTGTPTGSGTKQREPLLNEETAFAFLDPMQESALRGHNPFAFVHKVPERAQPDKPKRPWRRKKPEPEATPEVAKDTQPKPKPEAKPAPKPKPEVAKNTQPKPTPETEAKPQPKPKPQPQPKPKPKRFIAVLYRGIYRSGDTSEKQRAFICGSDSQTKRTNLLVVKEGQTFAGITVKDFSRDELVVTGPDGEQQTIALGKQKKIFVE